MARKVVGQGDHGFGAVEICMIEAAFIPLMTEASAGGGWASVDVTRAGQGCFKIWSWEEGGEQADWVLWGKDIL